MLTKSVHAYIITSAWAWDQTSFQTEMNERNWRGQRKRSRVSAETECVRKEKMHFMGNNPAHRLQGYTLVTHARSFLPSKWERHLKEPRGTALNWNALKTSWNEIERVLVRLREFHTLGRSVADLVLTWLSLTPSMPLLVHAPSPDDT